MDAAFSDACVRILNVTGCARQAEPVRGMEPAKPPFPTVVAVGKPDRKFFRRC